MLRDIKYVIYQKDTALLYKEYFQLEIKEDKNLVKYSDESYTKNIEEKQPTVIQVSDKQAMEFIDILFRVINKWKNRYENINILDGTEWKLQIKYSNGKIAYYSGKNDYPSNFEYLDLITKELLNKAKFNK